MHLKVIRKDDDASLNLWISNVSVRLRFVNPDETLFIIQKYITYDLRLLN